MKLHIIQPYRLEQLDNRKVEQVHENKGIFYFKTKNRALHEIRDHFTEKCSLLGTSIRDGLYFDLEKKETFSGEGWSKLEEEQQRRCFFIREN